MTKQSKIKNQQSIVPRGCHDVVLLTGISSAVSLVSLLYYFQRGEILLYGDAVAHINIARRVFDSQTPGLLQLGTVWLPLPHLLMLPLLLSDVMWRSGIGGSIPSMVAYVFGVVGIFRFTRGILLANERTRTGARAGAWIAALVYGSNPNLIYLQTTAMTEVLYLSFFVWTCVYFSEWLRNLSTPEDTLRPNSGQAPERGKPSSLWKCALCLAGAGLTRYDAWFLAGAVGVIVLIMTLRQWQNQRLRWQAVKFLAAIAVVPALWLAYNAAVYGDPLEFSRGPYSAKAIEQRTAKPGYPAHPGSGDLAVAASFFLKSAQLNMAPGNWGRIWVLIVLAAAGLIATRLRAAWIVVLLAMPVLFYALSIAYGGVPLFVPTWWPFTWYNIRYGLQLLPLFAVSVGLILVSAPKGAEEIARLSRSLKRSPDTSLPNITSDNRARTAGVSPGWWQRSAPPILAGVVVVCVGISYLAVWRTQPLCFTEAWVNSRTKLALESSVARVVTSLPPNSRYLMYVGDHVGVFQQAGIPLRHVINEGNHRPWVRPADPEGLWERALANPSKFVDWVIMFDGDAVDEKVDQKELKLVTEIHTTGQPHARIYSVRTP